MWCLIIWQVFTMKHEIEADMQEAPQVGWDPIAINYRPPWASRLFLLYLLLVVAISLVKSASVLRDFRRGSWEICSARIQSMRRLVFFTLLLSVLVADQLLRVALMQIAAQRFFGPAALAGGVAEALTVFALGVLTCTALYAGCGLCEGILLHRRAAWNRSFDQAKNQPPPA
jgi:hypothetical protein